MTKLNLFATTPKGLELLLVDELRALGATDAAEKLAGVTFTGDLQLAYKACLWSRLANRILLRLTQIPAATPEELYAGVQTIAWDEHIDPQATINVNFATTHSNITHTLFGAQKVKDAIVDQFRAKYQMRPNVARDKADVSVNVYLQKNIATLSIDLAGESLHQRGYRIEQGAAPLKENLAAAILLRAKWPQMVAQQGALVDPMCGSGTFLIEAALMAGDIAPGLLRTHFGFLGWKQHNDKLWQTLRQDAEVCREHGMKKIPSIVGYDSDARAIKIAFANIERAGMLGKIHVEKQELSTCSSKQPLGLLVANPPYGERLGDASELPQLYATLGVQLKKDFVGWQAAVITSDAELGKSMGLRARKQYALFNGAIPCQLLLFDVQPDCFVDRSPTGHNERRIRRAQKALSEMELAAAQMVVNRIRKNLKKLKSWAQRESISCYRVYDADLPEYAVAIDFYNEYACVQEYPAPKSVDPVKAEQRLQQVLAVLPEALNLPAPQIFLRDRATPIQHCNELIKITEQDHTFLVNLRDGNLNIGLLNEQRLLRTHIKELAARKHVLHLFSRSGVMTVYAGEGGARSLKAIAPDEFCLNWTQRNLELNEVSAETIHADVPVWIMQEKSRYELIVAELPESTFNLLQEFPELVYSMICLLSAQGELYLFTRDARFKIPSQLYDKFKIEDYAERLLPEDFARNPKIQQCWRIKL